MSKKQYVLTLVLAMIAGLAGGMVSSWLFISAPVFVQKTPQVAQVVRAERFEVVDQKGKVRAALDMKGVGLTMEDVSALVEKIVKEDKNLRAEWEKAAKATGKSPEAFKQELREAIEKEFFENPEPALRLYHEDGKQRAILTVEKEGYGRLGFFNETYELRVSLVGSDETPRLEFSNKSGMQANLKTGHDSAMLNFSTKGGPFPFASFGRELTGGTNLTMWPKQARESAHSPRPIDPFIELGTRSSSGEMGLNFANGNKSKIELGLSSDDEKPRLNFYEDGKLRAVLGSSEIEITRTGQTVKQPASSLVLFDKDEKVIWRVP